MCPLFSAEMYYLLSQTKKKQLAIEEKKKAIDTTIKAYNIEQGKSKEEQRSLWTICKDIREEWSIKHKKSIVIRVFQS